MSAKKENATIVGVGVAACAVCCAGPILGFLAAIGLSTAAGFAMFGTVAIGAGAVLTALVVIRLRRRAPTCASNDPVSVPVELTDSRRRS